MITKWKATPISRIDSETGLEIIQLLGDTEYDRLIYFTNNSFFDGSNRLVFNKTLNGTRFPAILDLTTMEYEPLISTSTDFIPTIVDPIKNLCYGICNHTLCSVNLHTRDFHEIYHIPRNVNFDFTCSEDGTYLYAFEREQRDLSHVTSVELEEKMQRVMNDPPKTKIIRIHYESGSCETLLDGKIWIAHVNVSPRDNNKLTFCHEGPWAKVDNRLWALDLHKKSHPEPYKLRERTEPTEGIGHEWWTLDSNWICYQSHRINRECIGMVNFQNSMVKEIDVKMHATHVHSISDRLFVLDSGFIMPYQRIVKVLDDGTTQHKILCNHGSDWTFIDGHSISVMAPNEKFCLFNGNRTGTSKIYLVNIPDDLSNLPDASDFIKRYQK